MIATSLAAAARPFWRLLAHYKIDAERVFREAGLDPELIDQPRARYKAEGQTQAWRKAAELIEDPFFGLKTGEFWVPADFHALGCAFLTSSTLFTALHRLSRYVSVVHDVVEVDIGDDEDNVSVTLRPDADLYAKPCAPQEDGGWAVLLRMCRAAYGQALNPVEIRFRHSAPQYVGDYYSLFRCPLIFDAPESAILFSRTDALRPLPARNRELAQANDKILSDFLGKLRKDDLITRVKTAITEELASGAPTDEQIAQLLFMSSRTLSRKLSALGTNYSQLVEAVRRELAEQYIADPALTISEIAFLLGFSEQSAFSRAFRRWTGQAPSTVREQVSA
ncbi:MAG: AraC family transcriptional regulator [Chromatiaceae bacterium]|jgi:AraC-like DNA-binding protein